MIHNAVLKSDLGDLARMQVQLLSEGGPEKNGILFEEIISVSQDILEQFGLPDSKEYNEILFIDHLPTDYELDSQIALLHQAANEYLLGCTQSEIQLLKDAVAHGFDSFDVLPELKIMTHNYTIFVYDHILLTQRDKPENVLAALRLAENSGSLNDLGILGFASEIGEKEKELIEKLSSKGIKYLDQYIEHLLP